MVATYRSTDSDPKEMFVHQQAGDGGYGTSSYIDLVAFREKDANTAWTSASDGVLEERLYYCQNQHADVVALVTSAGGQREMDRYSAYGVPFGLPVGDANSSGTADATDRTIIQAWINNTHYDVRADYDLNGSVTSADKTAIQNLGPVNLGHGALSASSVHNTCGYAGYLLNSLQDQSMYQVRLRNLASDLGIWQSRDPYGYINNYNLYCDVSSNPTIRLDPSGADYAAYLVALFDDEHGLTETDLETIKEASAGEVVLVGKAFDYARKKYNKNNRDGSAANAMEHCVASCIIGKQFGAGTAKKWGDSHEAQKPQPRPTARAQKAENQRHRRAKEADDKNNEQGRLCAAEWGSGSIEQACDECCDRKLRSGLLWTYTTTAQLAVRQQTVSD